MSIRPKLPPCALSYCQSRATYVDRVGVGFCAQHKAHAIAGKTHRVDADHPLDPWWADAQLAEEAGGAEAARWKDLDCGKWPQ